MSDRCFVRVSIRPEDRKVFEELGFHDEYEGESESRGYQGAIDLIQEEASSEFHEGLWALAHKGVAFVAVSDQGTSGTITPGCQVSCGGRLVRVETLAYGGRPAVELDEKGKPDPDQLKNATDLLALEKTFKALVRGVKPVKPNADEIMKNIDGPFFREQRRWVRALVGYAEEGTLQVASGTNLVDAGIRLPLKGLENLLDALADYAHDVHGKDCLFEEKEE